MNRLESIEKVVEAGLSQDPRVGFIAKTQILPELSHTAGRLSSNVFEEQFMERYGGLLYMVDLIIAPTVPIDPLDSAALAEFTDAVIPVERAETRMMTGPNIYITTFRIGQKESIQGELLRKYLVEDPDRVHFRRGYRVFREEVGFERETNTNTIVIQDPDLKKLIVDAGRKLVTRDVSSRPLTRIIRVLAYPNENIARLIASFDQALIGDKYLPEEIIIPEGSYTVPSYSRFDVVESEFIGSVASRVVLLLRSGMSGKQINWMMEHQMDAYPDFVREFFKLEGIDTVSVTTQ